MATKSESYRGYEISWQEPPMTSAYWTANVGSNDLKLQNRIGSSVHVLNAPTREAMLAAAKRYIDELFT